MTGDFGMGSVPMIRMVGQYAQRAVELLCQHDTHQSVRQREPRQREGEIASRQHRGRKTVGAAYQEREIAPVLHSGAEPVGELPRAHLRAVLIERHDPFVGTQRGHELASLASMALRGLWPALRSPGSIST